MAKHFVEIVQGVKLDNSDYKFLSISENNKNRGNVERKHISL